MLIHSFAVHFHAVGVEFHKFSFIFGGEEEGQFIDRAFLLTNNGLPPFFVGNNHFLCDSILVLNMYMDI